MGVSEEVDDRPDARWQMWLVSAVLVSAILSYGMGRLGGSTHDHHHAEPQDLHAWIHDELGLAEEQEQELRAVEREFEAARQKLLGLVRIAEQELAGAIQADRVDRPQVEAALEEINRLDGELRKLTLEHLIQMKAFLDERQVEQLVKWTHQSLSHPH